MSPFFLNGPDTVARQLAPTSRQSLLLLQSYHHLYRGAPTASLSSSSSSSTEDELSPDPRPQLAVTLLQETTPSHLEIIPNLSTPAPDRPLAAERFIAIPKKHPGRTSKATLKVGGVKAKGERTVKEIESVEGGLRVEKKELATGSLRKSTRLKCGNEWYSAELAASQ